MLPLLRPTLRRPPRLKIQRPRPLLPLRLQHDRHGPHKEYFQHPSQFPSNAYQLRVPPPEQRVNVERQQTSRSPLPPPPSGATRPSLLRRLIRATLVVSLSFALGWAAGTAIITWDYIQPPFEPGSEEAEELIDEIAEILDTCSIVQDLREHGFKEEPMHGLSPAGQHLVTSTLNNVQGFKTKFFRHPEQSTCSVLVFFAGFGIEGRPDYVHPGAVTTIMTEAAQQHCVPMAEKGELEVLPSGQFANIKFFSPVRPAEVYAVLVHEDSASLRAREVGDPLGFYDTEPEVAIAHGLKTLLFFSNAFPTELLESFTSTTAVDESPRDAEKPNTELTPQQYVEAAHSQAEAIATEGDYIHIEGGGSLHAAAQIDVMTRSKRITKGQDESLQAYGERLADEMQRVLRMVHQDSRVENTDSHGK